MIHSISARSHRHHRFAPASLHRQNLRRLVLLVKLGLGDRVTDDRPPANHLADLEEAVSLEGLESAREGEKGKQVSLGQSGGGPGQWRRALLELAFERWLSTETAPSSDAGSSEEQVNAGLMRACHATQSATKRAGGRLETRTWRHLPWPKPDTASSKPHDTLSLRFSPARCVLAGATGSHRQVSSLLARPHASGRDSRPRQ